MTKNIKKTNFKKTKNLGIHNTKQIIINKIFKGTIQNSHC